MAFCSKCGTQVPDEARFCPACGQPQAAIEAQPVMAAPEPATVQQGNPQQSYYTQPQEAQAPQQSYYAQPQEAQPPQQSYYAQPQEAQAPQQSYYAQPQEAQPPQQSYYAQPQQPQAPQQSYYAQPQQPQAAPQQSYYAQQPQQAPQQSYYAQQPQQNYYAQQPQAPQQYGYQQQQQRPPYQSGPADIEENKGISVLCYLGILLLIPLLSKPNSAYVRYHSNQGLVLIIMSVVLWILFLIPYVGWFVLGPLGSIFILVCVIMGIINAASGQMKPLPLVGKITLLK